MKKALGWALLPAMFLTLSTLAQANDWSKVRVYRAGYEQGYRDGMVRVEHGYREDAGYAKWMGHRGEYKKGYREGFQAAYYDNGHGRFARRDPRYAVRHPGGYLSNGYWGGSDCRDYGRGRYDHDLAYERGMERGYLKGLEKGREDFRKHRDYSLKYGDRQRCPRASGISANCQAFSAWDSEACHHICRQGPKARLIPPWRNAPG